MSASDPNSAIFVTDTPKEIKNKVDCNKNNTDIAKCRYKCTIISEMGIMVEMGIMDWFSTSTFLFYALNHDMLNLSSCNT